MVRRWRGGIPGSLLAAVLLAGCSRVNPDNYNRIEAGMSRDEVYAVLGKPDEVSGGGLGTLTLSSETWKGSKYSVHVTFAGEQLATKSIGPREE